MNINEFIKSFFGIGREREEQDRFGEHFWNNNEEHDEDDGGFNFNFHIDSNLHLELQREIQDMLKNFGNVEFFPGPLDPPQNVQPPKNPRDEMLKDGERKEMDSIFSPPPQHFPPFRNPFQHWFPDRPIESRKPDKDLDGQMSVDDVARLLEKPAQHVQRPPQSPMSFSQRSYSFSSSRGPDGRIEQKKTVRDQDGNEEVTVTRSIGNQSHSVTIKKDKTGSEEKIENYNNMDEGDLDKFNRTWSTPSLPINPALPDVRPDQILKRDEKEAGDKNNTSLFNKFFGDWLKPK